jgi:hypothetical protein
MSAALRIPSDGFASTSVRLPRATLLALRHAVAARALRDGARFSVSAVIDELVRSHLAAPPPACDAVLNEQDEDDRSDRRRG